MENSTVEFLVEVKENLKYTHKVYLYSNRNEINFNNYISDNDFNKSRLIIKKLSEQMGVDYPEILNYNRTVEEFCQDMLNELHVQDDHLGFITRLFNRYINYLEDEMYEVQLIKIECQIPKELTYEGIALDFLNCEKRIELEDYTGAITSARSLIEGVCKEILILNGFKDNNENTKLPVLFKNVRNLLNLNASNEKLEKPLKEVITGLNKVVNGLNEIRNQNGDSHPVKRNISKHHAVLTVNAAKTIVNFLFQTYEYQKKRNFISPKVKSI